MKRHRLDIIVKTPLGLERIAASRIEDLGLKCEVKPKPNNYPGIVIVNCTCNPKEAADRIRDEVPEAERVLVTEESVKAEVDEIVRAAVKVSKEKLDERRSFAVRTVRRGSHPYTSIDVNCRVGSAIIDATGATVNLDNPDRIVWIEIIDDQAAIGIIDGGEAWKKLKPGKYDIRPFFAKVSIIQTPYLGSKETARSMGSRIGRAAQMFEVKELVLGIIGSVDASQLNSFIQGVIEGSESRYRIQKRTYAHKPRKIDIKVQDLYQIVRDRRGEPIIIFEPEGEAFPSVSEKLAETVLSERGRINMFFGSREGIPKGIFRFADLIIDLCPGITLSTEYAASSALIGLAFALENKLLRRYRDKIQDGRSSD